MLSGELISVMLLVLNCQLVTHCLGNCWRYKWEILNSKFAKNTCVCLCVLVWITLSPFLFSQSSILKERFQCQNIGLLIIFQPFLWFFIMSSGKKLAYDVRRLQPLFVEGYLPFQEASNPPKGGHQLKSYEPQRKPPSWLSRCSLLWRMETSFHFWPHFVSWAEIRPSSLHVVPLWNQRKFWYINYSICNT